MSKKQEHKGLTDETKGEGRRGEHFLGLGFDRATN